MNATNYADGEAEHRPALPHARHRHGFARGPGRAPDEADHLPDRALQDEREGPPLAARPPEAGLPAPAAARLPEERGRRALPPADRAPRPPQVVIRRHTGRVSDDDRPAPRRGLRSGAVPFCPPRVGRFERRNSHATHQSAFPSGSQTLEIETGKLAKQADGAAVVRFGDTVVLATAGFAKEPKENADFFPLTVDYRENTVRGGAHPRRLVQARGAADREGDPDLPPDRPAHAAALPEGLQPRDADHRVRPLGRRPERPRRPRA